MNPQQQQMAADMLRQGGGQGMGGQQGQPTNALGEPIPQQLHQFGAQVFQQFASKYGKAAMLDVAQKVNEMPIQQMAQALQQIAQSLQGGQEPAPMPQQGQGSSMGDIQGY